MNKIIEGKVIKVEGKITEKHRRVFLEGGQCFLTSYHTLDELNEYVGKQVAK